MIGLTDAALAGEIHVNRFVWSCMLVNAAGRLIPLLCDGMNLESFTANKSQLGPLAKSTSRVRQASLARYPIWSQTPRLCNSRLQNIRPYHLNVSQVADVINVRDIE
jgi:hypothetical protein